MTTAIDLTRYKKRPDLRSWFTVAGHLALVVSPVYLAVILGPGWWWVLLWLAFGFLMNGLLNLMHECAHYLVFHSRGGSDFLGRWVLGPLALADFDGYRNRHWKHHTNFGIDGDTKDAYLEDIRGGRLALFFMRCLILAEAVRKFRHQTAKSNDTPREPRNSLAWLARTAAFHVIFFGSLLVSTRLATVRTWTASLLVCCLAYGFVYGYGLASITVFAATLRAVAEHQLEAGQNCAPRRAALRNFRCGPISWLVFGAYGFAEHGSHHREPGLPYYHLPQATIELAAQDPELKPVRGYLRELAALASSRPVSRAA
jgi:fatty acid desaturase